LIRWFAGLLEEHSDAPWFIESGTLLGAFRSGKFIPHDDDFDIGVYWEEDPLAHMQRLHECLEKELPAPLKSRVISSYCDKIEVYDPTEGNYTLVGERYGGADYHHVTVDLQAYTLNRVEDIIFPLYRASPFGPWQVPIEAVLPCAPIELEGQMFDAPSNSKAFLESIYGCLDKDAVYDTETGKYVKPGLPIITVNSEYASDSDGRDSE
jgi:hypothetical protein